MAINLNADVGTILKGLLGKSTPTASPAVPDTNQPAPSALRTPILCGVIALLATLGYVQFYYIPQKKALKTQIIKLDETKKMQQEIESMVNEQRAITRRLSKNSATYQQMMGEFSEDGTLKKLYDTISTIAQKQNLVMLNLKLSDKQPEAIETMVKPITVVAELQGKFRDYMNFRNQLLQEKPILSLVSEVVGIGDKEAPTGQTMIKLTINDYTIDKPAMQEGLPDAL